MSRGVASAILPAIHIARTIMDDLGFRPYDVAIVRRAWSGAAQGRGVALDTALVFDPRPKVRNVTQRELASDAGTLRDGDLRVGPITPDVALIYGTVRHTGDGTGTVAASSAVPATGVEQGGWSLVVTITTDGTTFSYSTDGGNTVSSGLDIAPTFDVPDIGIRLAFAGTFTPGDTYTASGTSVGYTAQQLRQLIADQSSELYVRLAGPDGTLMCTLVRADFDRALKYTLWVRRTRVTP